MGDLRTLWQELGGTLSALVILVEFMVIWVLYKRNNQLQDQIVEMMIEFSKEQRESQALSNKAIHTVTSALETQSELSRRVLDRLDKT